MTQRHNALNGSWLRATLVGACSAVVIATMTLAGAPRDGRTYLTFSHPVALPGVVLPAGSFTFEVVNPNMGHNVVRVLNRDRTRVHFMGLAQALNRPIGMPPDQTITLGATELASDPPPILAWYPVGKSQGFGFTYR